jgi:uncharacterized protein YjdB
VLQRIKRLLEQSQPSDADGDSLTYSISGSEINISSSGVLTFATAPDYETKTSYTATVTVSDGTDSATQDITVNVTDVDETVKISSSFSSSATFSAYENQTAIGSCVATDADGDSLTYSISGSEINISSSGVLTFASAPDYETKSFIHSHCHGKRWHRFSDSRYYS